MRSSALVPLDVGVKCDGILLDDEDGCRHKYTPCIPVPTNVFLELFPRTLYKTFR